MKTVRTQYQLDALAHEIIRKVNKDNRLAGMLLVNPVKALKQAGIVLSPSLIKEMKLEGRLPNKPALENIHKEVEKTNGALGIGLERIRFVLRQRGAPLPKRRPVSRRKSRVKSCTDDRDPVVGGYDYVFQISKTFLDETILAFYACNSTITKREPYIGKEDLILGEVTVRLQVRDMISDCPRIEFDDSLPETQVRLRVRVALEVYMTAFGGAQLVGFDIPCIIKLSAGTKPGEKLNNGEQPTTGLLFLLDHIEKSWEAEVLRQDQANPMTQAEETNLNGIINIIQESLTGMITEQLTAVVKQMFLPVEFPGIATFSSDAQGVFVPVYHVRVSAAWNNITIAVNFILEDVPEEPPVENFDTGVFDLFTDKERGDMSKVPNLLQQNTAGAPFAFAMHERMFKLMIQLANGDIARCEQEEQEAEEKDEDYDNPYKEDDVIVTQFTNGSLEKGCMRIHLLADVFDKVPLFIFWTIDLYDVEVTIDIGVSVDGDKLKIVNKGNDFNIAEDQELEYALALLSNIFAGLLLGALGGALVGCLVGGSVGGAIIGGVAGLFITQAIVIGKHIYMFYIYMIPNNKIPASSFLPPVRSLLKLEGLANYPFEVNDGPFTLRRTETINIYELSITYTDTQGTLLTKIYPIPLWKTVNYFRIMEGLEEPPDVAAFRSFIAIEVAEQESLSEMEEEQLVALFWKLWLVTTMTSCSFYDGDMKVTGNISGFVPKPTAEWPPEVIDCREPRGRSSCVTFGEFITVDPLGTASYMSYSCNVPELDFTDGNVSAQHASCIPFAQIVSVKSEISVQSWVQEIGTQELEIPEDFWNEEMKCKFFELLLEKTGNFDNMVIDDTLNYALGPITPPSGMNGPSIPVNCQAPTGSSFWNELGVKVVFTTYKITKLKLSLKPDMHHGWVNTQYDWSLKDEGGICTIASQSKKKKSGGVNFTISAPADLNPSIGFQHANARFKVLASLSADRKSVSEGGSAITNYLIDQTFMYPMQDNIILHGSFGTTVLTNLVMDVTKVKEAVKKIFDDYIEDLVAQAPATWWYPQQTGGYTQEPPVMTSGPWWGPMEPTWNQACMTRVSRRNEVPWKSAMAAMEKRQRRERTAALRNAESKKRTK